MRLNNTQRLILAIATALFLWIAISYFRSRSVPFSGEYFASDYLRDAIFAYFAVGMILVPLLLLTKDREETKDKNSYGSTNNPKMRILRNVRSLYWLVGLLVFVVVVLWGYFSVNYFPQQEQQMPTNPYLKYQTPQETPQATKNYIKIAETPTGFLRVRMEPITASLEITKVRTGEIYPVLAELEDWYKIRLAKGREGWVSKLYTEITNSP